MRARAQARHLLRTADEAYGTEEVERHVTAWPAARPEFTPQSDGPARDQWESVTLAATGTHSSSRATTSRQAR